MFLRSAFAVAACFSFAARAQSIVAVNEIDRPAEPAGLSSITHLGDCRFLSADDSGGLAFPLEIEIDRATGAAKSCAVGASIRLAGGRDVEGIAWDAANKLVWAADEDDASIRSFDAATGARRGVAPVPAAQRAFRDNRSLESLSISPDGLTMWTCNEEALSSREKNPRTKDAPKVDDGPCATAKRGSRVRLTRFVRATDSAPWKADGEFAWETDPVGGGAVPLLGKSQCGVSDVCALADGTLLVLEREMSVKAGAFLPSFRCRIYAADFAGATDVSRFASLTNSAVRLVKKTRLFDRDTGMAMYEGICAGPTLADGSVSLVLVSDADFGASPRVMALRYGNRDSRAPRNARSETRITNSVCRLASAAKPSAVAPMPSECRASPASVLESVARLAASHEPRTTNHAALCTRFPDADFIVLDDRVHTRYEADGSDATWEDEWLYVLTEKGRRAQASETLRFSARYGDAAFLEVEVYGTNGVARKIDFAKTLKTATDNSSMGANIYDPMDKKTSCAVPGLAVGEIRHVVTCRRTLKPRMKDTWADVNLLEHTAPIVSAVVTVDAPAARPIVKAVLRHPFGDTAERAPDRPLGGGRTLHKWIARDVPQAFPEPNMPPLHTQVQALRLSTIPDWQTVSRWYWGICLSHLEPSPEMRAKAAALVEGCADRTAKIRAVYRFVAQEVRYMGLTLEDDAPGYEPHDVALTFANRYGVCRDKAALLAAMLRLVGVEAFPTLIQAGAKMDAEVPMPYFNHAIVAVGREGAKGEYDLMDPTDESSRDLFPSYLSNCSYLVARSEGETLRTSPVVPVERNLIRAATEATLSEDGSLLVNSRIDFGGVNDNALRGSFMKRTPRERRESFGKFVKAVAAGAELLAFELFPADLHDTETPLSAKFTARLPDALVRGETRDELSLPFFTERLNVARGILDENTALEKRRFPLELPTTAGAEETISLSLGECVGAALPLPAAAKVGGGSFGFVRTVAVTNGTLSARRSFLVSGVEFAPDEYDALRDDLKETESAERERPRFAARENADAHVVTRLALREVRVDAPKRWTERTVAETEILDYSGKKSNSELRFDWNPCEESFRLVSATVSNRNGEVRSVTQAEINEMDAGWAAAAPRYPAAKIRVVNLPGVEIGSVVRYETVREVTNAATAWAEFRLLDSAAPTLVSEFDLRVAPGVEVKIASSPDVSPTREETLPDGARVWTWRADNPKRVPSEPSQGAASLWRRFVFATAEDWAAHGDELADALDAARSAGCEKAEAVGAAIAAKCATPDETIRAVRAYLAHNVRAAGPSLYGVPFALAFTPPDRALADGYASSADRMNLFRAMLEGAGFGCSFVLAIDDAHASKRVTELYRRTPRTSLFDALVVRALWRGGWLPFVGETREFFLAGENEYAPAAAASRAGDTYYDLASREFGTVPCADEMRPRSQSLCRIEIRADGAADFELTNLTWGAGVGGFRKRWAEMRPEWRSRTHQQMLGELAQNATATSELETDVEGYPASISFRAYVPDYAVVKDGVATLRIPEQGKLFSGADDPARKTPLFVGGAWPDADVVEVIFPRGYANAERLPEPFEFKSPVGGETWARQTVTTRVDDDRLVVRIERTSARSEATLLPAAHAALLGEWNRRASSAASRVVSARK